MSAGAQAAVGDLDPSFAEGGFLVGPTPPTGYSVVVSDDGSITVTGGGDRDEVAVVTRYTPAGALDSSFSGDGRFELAPGSPVSLAHIAAADDQGKTVLAGSVGDNADRDLLFVRLRADGELDASFGDDGIVTVDLAASGPGADQVADLAVAASGEVVAIAQGQGEDFIRALVRLRSDGSPDPSFGDGGRLFVPGEAGSDVAVAPDGSIFYATSRSRLATVTRIDASGEVDTAFGFGGTSWIDFPGGEQAWVDSLLLGPDGRLLVGGVGCNLRAVGCRHALVRLTPYGDFDASFGEDGVVTKLPGAALALDGSGRLLVGGASAPAGRFWRTFAVTRILPDGIVDRSFGRRGTAYAYFGLAHDRGEVFDLAVAPDQKVVAVGFGQSDARFGHAVARFGVSGGTADADGDGRPDAKDRCRFLPGDRHDGCPVATRTLTAKRETPRELSGQLRSETSPCLVGERIRIYRVLPGRDELVAEPRVTVPEPAWARRRGSWRWQGAVPRARYRTLAAGHHDRDLGYCQRVRGQTERGSPR